MVKSADQHIPIPEPGSQNLRAIGDLSPDEERDWDRHDNMGGSAGENAAMERTKVSGGRIAISGETRVTPVDEDTDEAEAAQYRRRHPLPSARRRMGKPRISAKSQARGEKMPSNDGQTPLNN